jgi:hypothetical protein
MSLEDTPSRVRPVLVPLEHLVPLDALRLGRRRGRGRGRRRRRRRHALAALLDAAARRRRQALQVEVARVRVVGRALRVRVAALEVLDDGVEEGCVGDDARAEDLDGSPLDEFVSLGTDQGGYAERKAVLTMDRERWEMEEMRMSGMRRMVMTTTTRPMPKMTDSWIFLYECQSGCSR